MMKIFMCGIFGYIGNRHNASDIVFNGLKGLEYRGYDSWGIAIQKPIGLDKRSGAGKINPPAGRQKSKILVEKHIGRVNKTLNSQLSTLNSQISIGHTRWATHGGVATQNAHPHLEEKREIAIIHNGIIENFSELKKNLIKKGHKFTSETDTEVAVHLIEDYLKKYDFKTSVKKAFNKLSGLNALVAMHRDEDQLVICKTGSPIVIGKAKDGYYLASDATGIIQHTKNILFLKDNEMAVISDKLNLYSLPQGKFLEAKFKKINWSIEKTEKGKYPHFMLKEIHDQPKIIKNILNNHTENVNRLSKSIKRSHGTFFIGAGTAFHACLAGTYLLSRIAHHHVNTAVASEFNYLEDFLTKKSLVIALSQSGETIDVIEPLQKAKKKGSQIAAITNALGSTIYRMADQNLLLEAGVERAVASTKAYTAKLCVLLLLSHALKSKNSSVKADMLKAIRDINRMLKSKELNKIKAISKKLSHSSSIYIIGRGISYANALEGALKIKEVSYIQTEGLAGGELKHGTIALISKGTPCIVFAPNDETYDATISNATEIKSRGGLIIGISYKNSLVFDHWIDVKDAGDATILSEIIPLQLLAYYLAVFRGNDPDMPRNLAKSVTVK